MAPGVIKLGGQFTSRHRQLVVVKLLTVTVFLRPLLYVHSCTRIDQQSHLLPIYRWPSFCLTQSSNGRTWHLLTLANFYQRPAATRHNIIRFDFSVVLVRPQSLTYRWIVTSTSDCRCTSPHSVCWMALCSVVLWTHLISLLIQFLFLLGRHR